MDRQTAHGIGHLALCVVMQSESFGLPPQEAPVMIAEKRKLFFSFHAK